MNLIYENTIDGINFKYYNGMDIESIHNHPKDGSQGMMIVFIENWEKELIKYKRNNKISELLNESKSEINQEDLFNINNNFVTIYQANGISIELLFETIKTKIERNQIPTQPWIPIAGITSGGLKIENIKVKN